MDDAAERPRLKGSPPWHLASLYYHCSSLIGADGLSAGTLFAVPVLGSVLWGAERRRRARAARD